MKQKILKTGGSLCVVVPAEFVRIAGIKKGDKVNVQINADAAKVIYKFSGTKQLPLSKNFLKKRKLRKY